MTRKSKPAKPAGLSGPRAGQTPPAPKPSRTPAHLPGQPTKGGFVRSVKPVPLPGKSRGR